VFNGVALQAEDVILEVSAEGRCWILVGLADLLFFLDLVATFFLSLVVRCLLFFSTVGLSIFFYLL
jgi:hypothetical protein